MLAEFAQPENVERLAVVLIKHMVPEAAMLEGIDVAAELCETPDEERAEVLDVIRAILAEMGEMGR